MVNLGDLRDPSNSVSITTFHMGVTLTLSAQQSFMANHPRFMSGSECGPRSSVLQAQAKSATYLAFWASPFSWWSQLAILALVYLEMCV